MATGRPADAAEAEPIGPDMADALLAPLREAAGAVLAVSGGPDSMTLLRLAAASRARVGGPPLRVATVDHGLRKEARAEAELVAAVSADLGLPHAILEWRGPKPRSRLQEAARDARYGLLTAHARETGASHLASAHTLDDQAETVLFRMARGSGPTGLAGMRAATPRDGIVHVRPLLAVRKARLVATCRANDWPFVGDPSNDDPRFARTRWRGLMVQLAQEGLTAERMSVLADRLRRAEAALDAMAEDAGARAVIERRDGRLVLDGKALGALPAEILIRVIGRAVDGARGVAGPRLRLERLEHLCADLAAALAARRPFSRTLAGALVWTRSEVSVVIAREPARKRARCDAPVS